MNSIPVNLRTRIFLDPGVYLKDNWKIILTYVLPFVVVVTGWHLLALNSQSLPTPVAVIQKIGYMMFNEVAGKYLYSHIGASLSRMGTGLVIGVGLGVPFGIYMGWNRLFEAAARPLFETFRMIPSLSWIPLSILFFGTSELGKVFIIVIAAFPPAVLNSWRGVRLVDPDMVTAAKILGANNLSILRTVVFPSALPSIFAGVQYSVSISWMCILAAELVAAGEGLGYLTYYGMEIPDEAMIAAGMLIIGVVGFMVSILLKRLEGVIAPWK
jgi:ABC-type nitrate/sulfonate/bicarbonate transport system permease component